MRPIKIISFIASIIVFSGGRAGAQEDAAIFVNGSEIFLHKNEKAGLKSFLARETGGNTYLGWITEHFNDAGSFLICRSEDGENFEIIGVQQVSRTPVMRDVGYFFIDTSPLGPAPVYYRITLLSIDNSFLTSGRIAVKQPAISFSARGK